MANWGYLAIIWIVIRVHSYPVKLDLLALSLLLLYQSLSRHNRAILLENP